MAYRMRKREDGIMENSQVAEIFDEISDLLELKGSNPFRVRSYRNAAQSLRNMSNRLEDLVADDQDLSDIPDIGEATAKKISEILKKGTCKRLEQLRRQVPAGLLDLMHIPGIGARKAMKLNRKLNIDSLDDLKTACRNHKVSELDGMGRKTEEKILRGIETVQRAADRILYVEAEEQLHSLAEYLDGINEIVRWETAGSFRRGRETIGDLDILVNTDNREETAEFLTSYSSLDEIISRGNERLSIRLNGGLQVDFRFFDISEFGSALMYFTGSKAHNIKLRKLAREKGWKLNEYGLFKAGSRLAGRTEKSVYEKLGMSLVPPELREGRGEVKAAQESRLPQLITVSDMRGDLQCHTTASDGKNSIREMAGSAREYGLGGRRGSLQSKYEPEKHDRQTHIRNSKRTNQLHRPSTWPNDRQT